MTEITVLELALMQILLKRVPNATARHLRVLLYLLMEKNHYFSLAEIESSTMLHSSELRRIMHSLAQKKIVEKEGCLYRKVPGEKIAEII